MAGVKNIRNVGSQCRFSSLNLSGIPHFENKGRRQSANIFLDYD